MKDMPSASPPAADPETGHAARDVRQSGAGQVVEISESDVPLDCAEGSALAVIAGIEGASYRPLGAVMSVGLDGRIRGNLSSGCIDRDVALHAGQALRDGRMRRLRYGAGSPFRDLELPCGGGLDILVVPRPDAAMLEAAQERLRARQPAMLDLGEIRLRILPLLRFLVFGKGPEARCFSALAKAAGYAVEAFSPDEETLDGMPGGRRLMRPDWPDGVMADDRTAIAMFFHDHDWEPPLLRAALASDAFYVGAQGSMRAHQQRCAELSKLGVAARDIGRLASPFGLIPSVRDPQSLAVSVLAQVLERVRAR